MLLVEIGLLIWAWRRGWKGWALLPLGIGLLLAVVVGALMGDPDAAKGFGLFLDFVCIGILIYMGARGRTTTPAYRASSETWPQENAR